MKAKLIQQMQSYVAETSVGASALRNQGGSGLIETARTFLKNLDLSVIPTDQADFNEWLDKETVKLRNKFPNGARHFGAARKALNLFLRSAAYNVVLNRAHNLDKVLPLLEVPLDSYTAKHLKIHDPDLSMRGFKLKSVRRADYRKYQKAATALATRWKVHRVDLDVFFYREEVDAA
ncbi:MAG: hypothetical protein HY360_00490 [Verrucomicrobia bacterium]|nr:hypothetical protein [Verrucomicrobiota bacterium]